MPSNIGSAIKRAREQCGLSQNQLAKRSGVSQSGISSIESTTKSPSLDTIADIAQALHMSVIALLELADSETDEKSAAAVQVQTDMLNDLTPAELQRVQDFVAGLKAARTIR